MNNLPSTINNPETSADEKSRTACCCFNPVVMAWLIGAFIYFASVFDGFDSLFLQPIIAAIVSAVSVGLVCGLGFLLRLSPLGIIWSFSCWLAVGLAAFGITVLLFGTSLGMSSIYTYPEYDEPFIGLCPKAATIGYFSLIFAVANWPTKRIKHI